MSLYIHIVDTVWVTIISFPGFKKNGYHLSSCTTPLFFTGQCLIFFSVRPATTQPSADNIILRLKQWLHFWIFVAFQKITINSIHWTNDLRSSRFGSMSQPTAKTLSSGLFWVGTGLGISVRDCCCRVSLWNTNIIFREIISVYLSTCFSLWVRAHQPASKTLQYIAMGRLQKASEIPAFLLSFPSFPYLASLVSLAMQSLDPHQTSLTP